MSGTEPSPPLRVELPVEGYHAGLIACQVACPVHTDARGYVRAIAEERFEEAYLIARGPNPFASMCGRICGAPCEAACRRGRVPRVDADGSFVANDRPIAIRALKRFACERFGPEARPPDRVLDAVRGYVPRVAAGGEDMAALLRAGTEGRFRKGGGERVAIVGAGPAGLSAAHDLALLGFTPVVYEAEPVAAWTCRSRSEVASRGVARPRASARKKHASAAARPQFLRRVPRCAQRQGLGGADGDRSDRA